MTAPNLTSITSIVAKSVHGELTTGGATVLTNAADSDKVYKINSIIIANTSGSAVSPRFELVKAGPTTRALFYDIPCPSLSTLILLDRSTAIYLEEGDSIEAEANGNSALDYTINYEEIS